MSTKQKLILSGLAAVIVLILIFYFWRQPTTAPQQEPRSTGQSLTLRQSGEDQQTVSLPARIQTGTNSMQIPVPDYRQAEMMETKMLWRTPIIFFGKVVDESNQPIAGVRVTYGANTADEQLTKEVRNEGGTTSDTRGMFEISGIRGRSFVLELSHPGYYNSDSNPPGFDYAGELQSGNDVPDSEAKAMVFHMHSKGNPVALIDRQGGLHKPADGTMMEFPLRGRTRSEILGHLQAQAWKGDADPQNNGHYDWKVKIAVLDGGLLMTSNEFDFVAPETGYQQSIEISMSKSDPNWKPSAKRTFFFKLPTCFARGLANMDLYHDFYFSMEYLVNPDGSANLEKDPTKPFQEQ